MPVNIPGTSTWETNVVAPVASDPALAVSARDGLEDLANRTKWLFDASMTQLWLAAGSAILDSVWSVDASATVPHVLTTLNGGAYGLYIPVRVPAKGTFSSVAVLVTGAATHAGVPATKPTLSLWKSSTVRSAKTQIGATITDPSASVGAYDADHWITLSGLSEVVAADTTYFLKVTNEASTNAAAQGLRIGMCKAVFTP
jgi:hypothetical protein